jgi:hypothetical protein
MNAFAELEHLSDPSRACFTVETASNFLKIEPDAEKAARIEQLSAKANEAQLTGPEEAEYWSYIYAGKMMSVLKLQARLFLKRASA